jgi:aryl-alcohol dehydrogenase-like predicted oxidoreductase
MVGSIGQTSERGKIMIYRELGSSGIEVSAVAFGAWAIGGWMWGGADENEAIDAIHASLDAGVNLIDTAPIYGYGRSEEIVGRAIRDRRDKVVLATKCGMIWDREEGEFFFHANQLGVASQPSEMKVYKCLRPKSIRQELERSLQRLGTDHVDLYQTHWQESTTSILDTMDELMRMKHAGKIRAIGVCNATTAEMRVYGPIDSDQERFSLIDRGIEQSNLPFCRRRDMAVLAYSPLANGLLTGRIRPDRQFGPGDLRQNNRRFSPENIERINDSLERLHPIADRHGATIAQLVIAWTFSQPGLTSALCGARNAQQAIDNAAAGDVALSTDELEMIDQCMLPEALVLV